MAIAEAAEVWDDFPMPLADDPSDEALMLRYAGGDVPAFTLLYGRHKAGLWRYLRHHIGHEAQAQELFQDVWAKVVNARAHYQPSAKFSTWLYTLAHHRMVDFWRAAKPLDALDDHAEHLAANEQHSPSAETQQAEQARRIRAAVNALPAEQREAFLLQAEADLSLAEIAQTQGVGVETVKSRLRYALAKLRGALADVWP
jgi:RNA polymerase sigma-70 factor (ECF subfamily)